MKTILNSIILIAGITLFIGCKHSCPDFDNDILQWTPYANGESFSLVNKTTDTVVALTVDKVDIHHTTSYDSRNDCGGCDDDLFIEGENISVYFNLTENKVKNQEYSVMEFGFSSYSDSENYTFESINYEKVRIFENKNSQKLIIAKGVGVVGLIDGENIWVLKNVKTKSTKQPPIAISNGSCG